MSKVKKKKNGNGGKPKGERKKMNFQRRIDKQCTSGGMTYELRKKLEDRLFYDPRASVSTQIDLYADNMNSVIPFRVPVRADVFAAPILAAVSYALQRGWVLSSNRPSDPYHASTYMIQLLIACAKNEIPQAMSVPRWLHYLCQSVIERKVRARTGQMDYSFEVITEWLDPDLVFVGPFMSANLSLQIKGNGRINGLFSNSAPPVAYTDELGAAAAQSMWLYLAGVHPNSPMHRNVSISETEPISRDASPYAVTLGAPGGGFGGVGGWFKKCELEVPIKYPLFSVFGGEAFSRTAGDNSRAPNFLRNFSGDGFMLGGMLTYKLMPKQLGMKNWPKVHFVDFNELFDVLAQAMTLAIGYRMNEQATRELLNEDPGYYVNEIQCPLTLQEVGLLLRATVMSAFDDSQLLGQAIYPRIAGRGDNEFVSFVCGTNTCPQSGGTFMRIPMLMKQNILALRERVINASRNGYGNPQTWIPVLGQYAEDRLIASDYFNVLNEEEEFPVFFDEPTEEFISFIDGMTPANELAWINDPGPLTRLAETWNSWTVRMGNYFWGFDTIGSDPGIDPLFSGCMTLHWIEGPNRKSKNEEKAKNRPANAKLKKKQEPVRTRSASGKETSLPKKTPMEVRWEKQEQFPSQVYAQREALAVSSYVPPFKNAWEGVQQMFVLPTNKIAPITQGDPRTFTSYPRIAAFENEEFQIPLGSGDTNFMSQGDRHILFATQMVKQIWADKDTTQKVIEKLEEQGDGGILSSLAASLAGKVIPGIGPIAEAIASVLPI